MDFREKANYRKELLNAFSAGFGTCFLSFVKIGTNKSHSLTI